jgi:hypothetical protein
MLRGCLNIQKQTMPSDYRRYLTETLLGASVAGEHKYDEAEPLLVGGYKGMEQSAASVSDLNRQKLRKAGEFVIQFYAAWNKPDKAEEWRQIMAKDNAAWFDKAGVSHR